MPIRPPKHRPLAIKARPNSTIRGYTWRWRRYRLTFLREHPLCVRCGYAAEHVDHIVPVAGADDPGFWDETNHQALCARCHNEKTAKEDGGFGR